MSLLQLRSIRIDGTPAIELVESRSAGEIPQAQSWTDLRDLALRAVVGASDLATVAGSLAKTGDAELCCRVVLPADVVDKIAAGTLQWREARDGRGKLPCITDATGKIRHQVRLSDVKTVSAPSPFAQLAAQQASTHSMLLDLQSQLMAIDEKVDDLLQNHKFRWWSDIEAGIGLFLELPEGRLDDPRVSESRQLISRGVVEGWHHVERTVGRIEGFAPVTFFQLMGRVMGQSSGSDASERRGIIDELHADLVHVLQGTQSLVRLHEHLGETDLAQDKASRLAERFKDVAQRVGPRHRLAEIREADVVLFGEILPSLTTRPPTPQLIIDTRMGELLALEAAHG